MLIKRGGGFKESEVTPHAVYINRRAFMLCAPALALPPPLGQLAPPSGQSPKAAHNPAYRLGDPPTPFKDVTTYNDNYEFGMNKDDPARLANTLRPRPWTVKVDGLCARPRTYDIDEILRMAPLEERIYGLRCVE